MKIHLLTMLLGVGLLGACSDNSTTGTETESSSRAIKVFTLDEGQVGDAEIIGDPDSSRVIVTVEAGTDLSAVMPTIEVSAGATIEPASGEPVDFAAHDNSYTYTVTSGSGVAQQWHVEIIIEGAVDDLPPEDTNTPSLDITWHESTERKISHDVFDARYARVHRVSGNTLLLVYKCNDWLGQAQIAVRRSTDNGSSWSSPTVFESSENSVGIFHPDFITLANGDIILAYTSLHNSDSSENGNVQIRTSTNQGQTWSSSQVVATGRSWEAAMIQLPDGEVQMFYSSEEAWASQDPIPEQEILMIRSADNGTTWTTPERVAYTSGRRDGMPVPLAACSDNSTGSTENSSRATQICVSVSDSPTGPFSDRKVFHEIDDRFHGNVPRFYWARAQPEYINEEEELLMTYDLNGLAGCESHCEEGRLNPDVYRPKGVRVPLELIDSGL